MTWGWRKGRQSIYNLWVIKKMDSRLFITLIYNEWDETCKCYNEKKNMKWNIKLIHVDINWITDLCYVAVVSTAALYQHLSEKLLRWGRLEAERREWTVIYYLASWYSGSASSGNSAWEWTVCVACDVRKQGVGHSLTSPLSLRGDSHSRNLTGCPWGWREGRGGWKGSRESDKKRGCLRGKSTLSRNKD